MSLTKSPSQLQLVLFLVQVSRLKLVAETKNELVSMVWRTDGVKDDEMTEKWAKKNEQEVRDYGTESWVKLRYQERLRKQ